MISIFIIWLANTYRNTRNKKEFISIVISKINFLIPRISLFLILMVLLLTGFQTNAQTKELHYQILRGNDVVGSILFSESDITGVKKMKMESQVKGKILFISYSGMAKEETIFRDGVLIQSSIYRRMNGKEKINKQHQAVNNQYVIRTGEKTDVAGIYPITYNMLSLYSSEPVNVSKVYSDNFQDFIPIKNMGDHQYKISLPNGDTNYYYYKNGILARVTANSTWYSVTILLKS